MDRCDSIFIKEVNSLSEVIILLTQHKNKLKE